MLVPEINCKRRIGNKHFLPAQEDERSIDSEDRRWLAQAARVRFEGNRVSSSGKAGDAKFGRILSFVSLGGVKRPTETGNVQAVRRRHGNCGRRQGSASPRWKRKAQRTTRDHSRPRPKVSLRSRLRGADPTESIRRHSS
jgi:hypothetical protein